MHQVVSHQNDMELAGLLLSIRTQDYSPLKLSEIDESNQTLSNHVVISKSIESYDFNQMQYFPHFFCNNNYDTSVMKQSIIPITHLQPSVSTNSFQNRNFGYQGNLIPSNANTNYKSGYELELKKRNLSNDRFGKL